MGVGRVDYEPDGLSTGSSSDGSRRQFWWLETVFYRLDEGVPLKIWLRVQ